MGSVNTVILVGNLGADPELRYTKGDQPVPVCNLRVATTFKGKGQAKTEWHRVVAWNTDAENCAKYLKKGRSVYIQGRLETRMYESGGQKRASTEIIAERIVFMSDNRPSNETRPAAAPGPAPAPEHDDGPGFGDDDVNW